MSPIATLILTLTLTLILTLTHLIEARIVADPDALPRLDVVVEEEAEAEVVATHDINSSYQQSAFSNQRSAISIQQSQSAFSIQHSAINNQQSIFSNQHSAIRSFAQRMPCRHHTRRTRR
jgi:hypothetical protein